MDSLGKVSILKKGNLCVLENLICISSGVFRPISANQTSMEREWPGETSREGHFLKN